VTWIRNAKKRLLHISCD